MQPGLKRPEQQAQPDFGQQVLKKLIDYEVEYRFQQKVEAEQAGVPPEETLRTLINMYAPQTAMSGMPSEAGWQGRSQSGQTGQPFPAPSQQSQPQGQTPPLNQAMAGQQPRRGLMERTGLVKPTRFDPNTGSFETGSMLFGLIHPNAQDVEAQSRTAMNIQKMQGKEPIQPTDMFKEQELYRREAHKQMVDLEKQRRLTAQNLYEAFNNQSQPFITMRDAQGRMEEAAKDPSPVGDLALIFSFMKVLDPGSTVREGEYATAQNSASVPERVRGQYNAAINGQKLSSKTRADFLDRSRRLFKGAERQYGKATREFAGLARRNGIDPSAFMTDQGLAQVTGSEPPRLTEEQAKAKGAVAWDNEQGIGLDANGKPVY